MNLRRREFVKLALTLSGSLMFEFDAAADGDFDPDKPFSPSIHLRIDPDNTVTLRLLKQEMGGVSTGARRCQRGVCRHGKQSAGVSVRGIREVTSTAQHPREKPGRSFNRMVQQTGGEGMRSRYGR
jgi:hypothetical protein